MIQDYILATGNAVFVLALLPSLLDHRAELCRTTSITTGTILAVFAATHVTMAMPWAAAMNVAGAAAWYALALLRPIRSAPDEPIFPPITEVEWTLVQQFRTVMNDGQPVEDPPTFQKGGYVNGPPPPMCGGCPSNRQ